MDGEPDGWTVAFTGENVGLEVNVGDKVGKVLGDEDGLENVGEKVGDCVVGDDEGRRVGDVVGRKVGDPDGELVGEESSGVIEGE